MLFSRDYDQQQPRTHLQHRRTAKSTTVTQYNTGVKAKCHLESTTCSAQQANFSTVKHTRSYVWGSYLLYWIMGQKVKNDLGILPPNCNINQWQSCPQTTGPQKIFPFLLPPRPSEQSAVNGRLSSEHSGNAAPWLRRGANVCGNRKIFNKFFSSKYEKIDENEESFFLFLLEKCNWGSERLTRLSANRRTCWRNVNISPCLNWRKNVFFGHLTAHR